MHGMTCHKKVTEFNIQFSQGSAATYLRWGGRFYSSSFCSISENAAVEELLKLVNIWPSYCKNKKGALFMAHSVVYQTRSPTVARMADRTPHSRWSMQKLCRIHLAMLIHRDRRVRVRIRISVRVRVNSVQITASYSHSSRKTNPNSGPQFIRSPVRKSAFYPCP